MTDAATLPLWIIAGIVFLILQIEIIRAVFRTAKAAESCAADLRKVVAHLGLGGKGVVDQGPKFASKQDYEKWKADRGESEE